MPENIETFLKSTAEMYKIPYEKVLELYDKSNSNNPKEYLICCKIQAFKARKFLLDEFGENIFNNQAQNNRQGFILVPLKPSEKPIIK